MPKNVYFKNNQVYKDDIEWTSKSAYWLENKTYSLDSLVLYNGNIYTSLSNNNVNNEPTDGNFWKIFQRGQSSDVIKEYDFSIEASSLTTLNHQEDTQDLFVFSRTPEDEIILPDVIILDNNNVRVEVADNYSVIRTNLLPIEDTFVKNQAVAAGSSILSHNKNMEDYFVFAKDNSKVAGQLLLPDVLEQTNNSCLMFFSEGFQDINYYLVDKKTFNKTRKIDVSTPVGASTIDVRHNVGNSDYFIWAVDNDSNKEVIFPDIYRLGERYATLGFDKQYNNLSIYFGGTVRDSIWHTGTNFQTAKVAADNTGNEWKVFINSSGSMLTSIIV